MRILISCAAAFLKYHSLLIDQFAERRWLLHVRNSNSKKCSIRCTYTRLPLPQLSPHCPIIPKEDLFFFFDSWSWTCDCWAAAMGWGASGFFCRFSCFHHKSLFVDSYIEKRWGPITWASSTFWVSSKANIKNRLVYELVLPTANLFSYL